MGIIVSLLVPIVIVAVIVGVVSRAVRGRDDPDAALSVRRLFVYLLLLATLAIAAAGVQALLDLAFDTEASLVEEGSARQARGLAFVLVGVPSYVLLFRYLLRELGADPREERSLGWRIYLNLTLGIA